MVQVGPDGVLFAKNSDRDPNEAQLLEWTPATTHTAGSRARCTWIDIPQVAATRATLVSRPFWMWGAEIGTNDAGVTIGNEAVFTDQPYDDVGLTGMDLLRLALERAGTAQAAVEVLVELLEAHGQGGGCGHERRSFTYHNSFLVADGTEAWVLETAGPKWATERVTSGARSISNGLTIEGFAEHHADRLHDWGTRCSLRRAITEPAAAAASGPLDLMAALRRHGDALDDTPDYSPLFGGLAAPCAHAGGLVAATQTTASWVSRLGPDGAHHWATASAAPCTSIFKPVAVEHPLDLGPAPTDRFDAAARWWRHELLHRRAVRDPDHALPLVDAARAPLEARFVAAPPTDREGFAAAVAEADALEDQLVELLAASDATVHAAIGGRIIDRRPPVVRRYWRVRNRRAGLTLADR